jgi:hypothetical protein
MPTISKLQYLDTTITINKNEVHEKIKRRMNSANAFYYSLQKLLTSCLLS